MMRRFTGTYGWVLAGMAMSLPAAGAEFTLDAQPSAVTVFADGAVVHRTGGISLPAGQHVLIVRGLPSSVPDRSLKVEGEGAFVIGAVESRRVNGTEAAQETERAAAAKVTELADRKHLIEAEKAAIEAKRHFLEGLADSSGKPASDSPSKASIDPAQWRKAWETIEAGYGEAGKAIVAKDVELRRADAELAKAQADLDALKTGQRDSLEVRIAIEAKQAGPIKLDLAYRVSEASWAAVYDLRLDTEKGALGLTQQGAVTQRTGEDWKNVRLTLSTARTQIFTAMPQIWPWWVDLPKPVSGRADSVSASAAYSSVASAPSPAMPMNAISGMRDKAEQRLATVQATEFNSEFVVPGELTVSSGTVEKRVTLAESKADARIELRATPSLDNKAYLYAVLRQKGETPLRAGLATLYRDGAYVGETQIAMVRPGEEASFAFGADDKIRLRRTVVTDERSRSGTFSSDTVLKRGWRTEIENLHGKPVRLTIFDHVPQSRDERLKVTLTGAPPSHTNRDDQAGIDSWDLDLAAKQTKQIDTGYEARWPESLQPIGL